MRLQKSPTGLLGAFDLKVEGMNPPEFSDALVPVADVYDNYLALNQRIQRTQTTIANPATFGSTTHAVPVGKVWRLLAVSLAGVLDAADAALTTIVDVRLSSDPNNTNIVLLQPFGAMARGGATNRACKAAFVFPRPIFMPPGWSVLTTIQLDAAPAVSFVYDSAVLVHEFDA